MADPEQVARLLDSATDWNLWRAKNPQQVVDLSGANLSEAPLSGADLSRADLIGADLSGADLSRARLIGAYLIGADLSRADLIATDLRGADLRGACLSGADLAESLFLTQTQIEAANGDLDTGLSPSLVRPQHWCA